MRKLAAGDTQRCATTPRRPGFTAHVEGIWGATTPFKTNVIQPPMEWRLRGYVHN